MSEDRKPQTRRELHGPVGSEGLRGPSESVKNEPPRSVLAPAWEEELRAGQAAEGEHGSVEPELAIVHLLRHAVAPESLRPGEASSVWSAIDREIRPVPWWRAHWLRWTAPLVAVAAATVLVIVIPVEPEHGEAPSVAVNQPLANDEREAASAAQALEAQFAVLAPEARARLQARVDDEREVLRSRLLADAIADGRDPRSVGGAP